MSDIFLVQANRTFVIEEHVFINCTYPTANTSIFIHIASCQYILIPLGCRAKESVPKNYHHFDQITPSTPRMSHVVRAPEHGAIASPVLPTSNTMDRPVPQSQLQPTEVAGPSRPPRLSRQSTNNSIHAQNSLRRMATHETGHGIDEDHDGNDRLDTHDEHSEHHDHLVRTGPGGDEETKIGAEEVSEKKPKAPELQDQTNLLPVRQVILVFVGLTCALFCSLIDQTMYVFPHCVRTG